MLGNRKTRLTADGWYYVLIMGFLLAGAALRDINLLYGVFGLMVASLVWHWRHAVGSLKRINLRRHAPRQVAAGDSLSIDLTALNGRRRGISWAVVVEDTLRCEQGSGPALRVKLAFARLGPSEGATQTYQGQLTHRGRYVFGPLQATTRFPLGLVRHTVVIDRQQSLLVVPRQGRLTDRWRQRERQLAQGNRSSQQRQGSADGDFHSLRPYRSGDSRHLIHWRTSARQGQLMVRQFERQQTHDLAVFLDLWQPDEAGARERETVELAVSLAATVLVDRCRLSGSRLLLSVTGAESAGGRPRHVHGAASATLLNELMEALALAEASPHEGLAGLLAGGLERTPDDAEAVLISTRHVDPSGDPRLASVTANPRTRDWLQRMLVIDASREELFDYFEP